ncbi:MAG: glycosyltransferase [Cyanobacteriota bacterium]|nr:glycosyltransferase [Cyanobacteriota bacterium]
MPLVSIIVPVYNGETTIQETIESVLNQTFRDFELLIINDGSQDATLEVIDRIQDPRVKVFSYSNSGVSTSRNRGISLASGEYISFIDADDLWTPDKLEAQFNALQANPEAGVAYSWTDYIDESGQVVRQGPHFNCNGDAYAKLLLSDFVGSGSNPLIRKQAFIEVGGFDESLSLAADWDMWLRLAARYQFVAVPSIHILYRQVDGSMSSNVWRMEAESLQIIQRAIAQAPESIQHLKQTCIGNRYKGLTWKTLGESPERRKGLIAARFLWLAIRNEPSLLRKRIIWKVLLKIAIVILLPAQPAQALLTKMKRLANLEALLVHIQTEPF